MTHDIPGAKADVLLLPACEVVRRGLTPDEAIRYAESHNGKWRGTGRLALVVPHDPLADQSSSVR